MASVVLQVCTEYPLIAATVAAAGAAVLTSITVGPQIGIPTGVATFSATLNSAKAENLRTMQITLIEIQVRESEARTAELVAREQQLRAETAAREEQLRAEEAALKAKEAEIVNKTNLVTTLIEAKKIEAQANLAIIAAQKAQVENCVLYRTAFKITVAALVIFTGALAYLWRGSLYSHVK